MNINDWMNESAGKVSRHYDLHSDKIKDQSRVLGVVAAFKKDYCRFFKGVPFMDNITQLYWHRLELVKARYKKKGVTLDTSISPRKGRKKDSASITWKHDGKYLSAMVQEPVDTSSTYYLNGKPVKTIKGSETACYTVVESLRQDLTYVCPHCGAEQSMQQLIDGCDFCDTQFEINDFSSKISSFSLRKTYKDTLRSAAKGFGVAAGLCSIIAAVWSFNQVFAYFSDSAELFASPILLSLLCALLGGIAGFLGFIMLIGPTSPLLYYLMLILAFRGLQRGRNQTDFENDIRQHDPLFSISRFTGNMENKLLSIHFADKYEDVSSVAICDLSKVIRQNYLNVLDCMVDRFEFQSYRLSDQYQYVDMQAAIELLILEGTEIRRQKELVTMTLMKSKFQMTQEICDAVIYKCDSCGSSISMLNGGKCKYCGTKLNMAEYDWVVSSYSSTMK